MTSRELLRRVAAHWPAKVLSVAAAIILFMFNRMSTLEERFLSIPLHVETGGDFVAASQYPRMVRLTMRGEGHLINSISEEDVEAYIDLQQYTQAGVYRSPILVRKKGTASGVDPLELRVDPLEVAVAVEKRGTKTVSITPAFRGYLEPGYELASWVVEPSHIEISGAQSVLEKINDVTTEMIEVSGRRENFSVRVKLLNRNPLITIGGDDNVDFSGTIQQSMMVKSFDHLPIILSGLPSGFVARLPHNFGSIKLEGSQNDLEAFEPDASLLSIDCSSIHDAGTYTLPLVVSSPANFVVLRYEPMEMSLEVTKAEKVPE